MPSNDLAPKQVPAQISATSNRCNLGAKSEVLERNVLAGVEGSRVLEKITSFRDPGWLLSKRERVGPHFQSSHTVIALVVGSRRL